jgi:WD40 repeat protein
MADRSSQRGNSSPCLPHIGLRRTHFLLLSVASCLLIVCLCGAQSPPVPPASVSSPKDDKTKLDRYGDPLPPGAVARLGTLRLRHQAEIREVATSFDGQLVASVGLDGTVRLWESRSGKQIHRMDSKYRDVRTVAFSPDGTNLATGGFGSRIHIWNVSSGKQVRELRGHQGTINCLRFSPSGSELSSPLKNSS